MFKQLSWWQKIKDKLQKKRRRRFVFCGVNNRFLFSKWKTVKKMNFYVYGDNNEIIIKTDKVFLGKIFVGMPDCPVNSCRVIIEEEATSNGAIICLLEDNSSVIIGEDVMLADNIKIYASDTHTILNAQNQLINIGQQVNIGKHVWLGTGVLIAKNSIIADGCVVGMGSVVAGKFTEPNCVIAGNPAKVVKRDICWNRERPNNFLKQQREKK